MCPSTGRLQPNFKIRLFLPLLQSGGTFSRLPSAERGANFQTTNVKEKLSRSCPVLPNFMRATWPAQTPSPLQESEGLFLEGYSENGWKDGGLKRNVPRMKKELQNIYFGKVLSRKKKPAKWSCEGEEDLPPPWTTAERVRRQARETRTPSTFFRRSWVISQETHLCYVIPSVVVSYISQQFLAIPLQFEILKFLVLPI